ncbi:hypothetical protein BC628DRAFT_1369726 [Trametes gibbosa]|nr:hypothetical protein BC628DRAFT_1369726 [Trametes gibbosa]
MLPTPSLRPPHHDQAPSDAHAHQQTASASTCATTSSTQAMAARQPKPASFTAGYRDIFDAPERPGEPSTHVRFSAATPSHASYSSSNAAAPQTLPPPILFDGPARPLSARALVVSPHRTYRTHPSKVWPRPLVGGARNAVRAVLQSQ